MLENKDSLEKLAENWYHTICDFHCLSPEPCELVKGKMWLLDNYTSRYNHREMKLRFCTFIQKLMARRVSKQPSTNILSLLEGDKLLGFDRKILRLHFIEGKKLREIEGQLSCSYGTVQKKILKLKERFGLIT